MGLISYIKKRKRNVVLAILAFILFKALVFATFFQEYGIYNGSFFENFIYSIGTKNAFEWLFDINIFSKNRNGWYLDLEVGEFGMGDGLSWILAIILFAMIIYAFNDRIKAK
tara:strand:- start:1812 stop:2147 length:336 start_codon:yes stop_codon:yes gene_type:complete